MMDYRLLVLVLFVQSTIAYIAINRHNLAVIYVDRAPVWQTRDARPTDHAKVARTLVHKANWAATGTISTNEIIKGYPMVNVISIADSGKDEKSTGHIYYYLTNLDYTANDINADNKITFMISEDEDLACSKNKTDPMEPTCARVIISGKNVALNNSTQEYKKAKAAFISRHPAATRWINVHSFFLCTIDIMNIFVLDWYGGPHQVSPDDYYKVPSE